MTIDDAIKNIRTRRAFGNFLDPTHQTHFCQQCARPVVDFGERLDGARNVEEIYEKYCNSCHAQIQKGRGNGNEQNLG